MKGGPELNDNGFMTMEHLIEKISSDSLTQNSKFEVMQQAVVTCPCISLQLFEGVKIPSLLDSGSMVTLIKESYFGKEIEP